MTSRGENTAAVYDELRRIEGEVVQGERQLAEQEALLVALRRQNEDTANVREELERLRTQQRAREHERQRLSFNASPVGQSIIVIPELVEPAGSLQIAIANLRNEKGNVLLGPMARYFFDFRSNGAVSTDDEGVDLSDAQAAHQTAVGALADGIRDFAIEGSSDVHFGIEVRDDIGRVLDVTAKLGSKIYRKQ